MTYRLLAVTGLAATLAAAPVAAEPTRSSPIQVAPSGTVFVVNPDSSTVARLDFDATHVGTLTHEAPVGRYPRTLALDATHVFTADQSADTVSRLDQADLGNPRQVSLRFGCNPYGVAVTPSGSRVVVSCQGSSDVVILDGDLNTVARVDLRWPGARAIAIASDGARAYVTHFLTEEPVDDAHVSVVDLVNNSLAAEFAVPPDTTTCENQNSGQGVINLVSTITIVPDGAPAEVAGQVWIGGTQQNNLSKGLFKRSATFKDVPGASMFPFTFAPFPDGGGSRNVYRASFHDVTRFGIYKLDRATGNVVGKIDVDEANSGTDIAFSPDGVAAYVVDHQFNSYHVFNTARGQRPEDVTTLFGGPSRFGPGGAEDDKPCLPAALANNVNVSEAAFRVAPQAEISTIRGYDPADVNGMPVKTGLDFDTVIYMASGTSQMREVADGIGTAPMGVALSPDGATVYVANYLSRNVVPVAAVTPLDGLGRPANFRCSNNFALTCGTTNDCEGGGGFCNHPGGAACTTDADCGTNGPCIATADCVPLILGPPVSSLTGGIAADPLPPALLDGKNLFNTAARDSSVPNNVGLDEAAPLFNQIDLVCEHDPARSCGDDRGCGFCASDPLVPCTKHADCGGARCVVGRKICADSSAKFCSADADCPGGVCEDHNPSFCSNNPAATCAADAECPGGACRRATCSLSTNVPGEVVSTAHDASYVTCTACHADFGGQDGRTWDFSQFGASLRNTMDLRGRAGFAPGTCSGGPNAGQECTFDAACGDGFFCKANPAKIPPNIAPADRDRWFNPMLTVHWNGDRDEVEDFEHTYRALMGAGDCDTVEDKVDTCLGALIQRSRFSSADPVDVNPDLGPPNRNIRGPLTGKIAGIRLTNMADFVYSLTEFVRNPNAPTEASERGRQVFNDPSTECTSCHNGGPGAGKQFFTKKAPNAGFDPSQPPGADHNNPFVRDDVGTANLFDQADPNAVAQENQTFQNPRVPIPGKRGTLGAYVTPVLNDLWNTAPYLHDGSAHTLLDVVRACNTALGPPDDCYKAGRGRNLNTHHGRTDHLTPQQLNDLVAFQKTLTLTTVVGTDETVLRFGALELQRVQLKFGKKPGRDAFKVRGLLSDVPAGLNPAVGVVLTLAVPKGEAMQIVSRPLTMSGSARRARGRSSAGGNVNLALRQAGAGRYRLVASGKRLDLAALNNLDNRDVTVSLDVGGTTFTLNRNLTGKKRVFKLPKKQKR